MRESEKAVKTLAEFIIYKIREMTKNLSYDRTIKTRISNIIENGKYEVKYGGVSYYPTALNNMEYSIGDNVFVTFPQGVTINGFIVGKF